ncbi:MAG: excisionase family DNA-binding protein [Acidobacteria bacterium]|nr:excisionase family DNA-binding protein [Acidobacteriota bacterium]
MTTFITVKEFARTRRCTTKYVYDLLAAGRLKGARKQGRVWRIPEACVQKQSRGKEKSS